MKDECSEIREAADYAFECCKRHVPEREVVAVQVPEREMVSVTRVTDGHVEILECSEVQESERLRMIILKARNCGKLFMARKLNDLEERLAELCQDKGSVTFKEAFELADRSLEHESE